METNISFNSDGIEIVGALHLPDDIKPGEKRALFITIHGFGGAKVDSSTAMVCPILCDRGYITVRFDSSGCGKSGSNDKVAGAIAALWA